MSHTTNYYSLNACYYCCIVQFYVMCYATLNENIAQVQDWVLSVSIMHVFVIMEAFATATATATATPLFT